MSNYCIICEYNPLHNGHVYLIERAKALGATTVTCIMSGNATQRGELAVTDKYLRAEAAIKSGADLVLELPFPWSCASAEFFGLAGVSIAQAVGDKLIFGSECGDTQFLESAASFCETDDFKQRYESCTRGGIGSASAYIKCLSEGGFGEISSNDLLGISYIRAIKRLGLSLEPVAEKRIGAGYNCEQTVDGAYQSATALRRYIERCEIDEMAEYIPSPMLEILKREYAEGRLTDINEISDAILCFYRLASPENLERISDMGGGLSNRFISIAKKSISAERMMDGIRTKRYTDAKLRRAMLFGLTGTSDDVIRSLPEYTLVLGADENGRKLISEGRKREGLRLITKPADAPKDSAQFILSEKLDSIFGLARRQKYASDEFIRKKAYVQKYEKSRGLCKKV